MAAGLLAANEKDAAAPSAAEVVAGVPNEKAAPVDTAGGAAAAVPNEKPVLAAEAEAGAVDPNEKPLVDANDAAGAAEPNEKPLPVLPALPNEKAGAEEAEEAAGC